MSIIKLPFETIAKRTAVVKQSMADGPTGSDKVAIPGGVGQRLPSYAVYLKRIQDGTGSMAAREIKVASSDSQNKDKIRNRMLVKWNPVLFNLDKDLSGDLLDVTLEQRRRFLKLGEKSSPFVSPVPVMSVRPIFRDLTHILPDKTDELLTSSERRRRIDLAVKETTSKLDMRPGIVPHDHGTSDYNYKTPAAPDFVPSKVGESATTIDRPITKSQAAASSGLLDKITRTAQSISFDPKAVKFSIARFPVWRRGTDVDLNNSEATGGIKDKKIPRGRYLFHFDAPKISGLPAVGLTKPVPFKMSGKQMVLEKAVVDPNTGKAKLQIEVRENVVLLIGVVGAALVAGGFALYNLDKSLAQVDKIVVDTAKGSTKLVTAFAIGAAVYVGVPILKRKYAS